MPADSELLKKAYQAFNARDVDAALATMDPDVIWPNGMEGGYVYGHRGVQAYWLRQWQLIDPRVEPIRFETLQDGSILVEVRQLVRNLAGDILKDQVVHHVYVFEGGRIKRMDIRTP